MFTIGCDPEFFIQKNKKYMSAINIIKGTKEEPHPIPGLRGAACLQDNVAVEFNTPACNDKDAFIRSIQFVLTKLQRGALRGFDFSKESAVFFEEDQLQHPKAQEFGCEPDYNAWTKDINPRPKASDANLRSAGGHIHVGTKEDPIEVIRAMDLFLGVPSILKDKGKLRRQLYGKAGSFRPKNYGCEYRTLSNFWIFSEDLIGWAYDQTQKAVEFVEAGELITPEDGLRIQNCINNDDMRDYEHLSKAYGLA